MLREIIDQWAVECPERIAHHYRDYSLTYQNLKECSDALALWIHENLAEEQSTRSPIVVYGHKENEMLIAFLACIKSGHPYVPVDTSVPLERVGKIIEASGAKLLLSPQEVPSELGNEGLLIKDKLAPFQSHPMYQDYLGQALPLEWQVGKEDVYYIIYTSGSTGTPKGVQITLEALESYLNWVNTAYKPIAKQEVFLNQAPFSFDLSVMDLYMSLSTGGTLWSIDKAEIANPRELFQSFSRSGVTFWVSTPSFAEICLMDKSFNETLLPELKHFLFCGEVLLHDTATKLLERFPKAKVENLYGPTEATVAVTTVTVTPEILAAYNPLPVGQVKPDAQVLICDSEALDRALQETGIAGNILKATPPSLPRGERGEIVIAGPNVSIGYLNNPEQTQKAFFSWKDENGQLWRAYRTGDAGSFKEEQLLFYGRLDFQVKLHGYRIELGDIEENLRKLKGVENAVVLPIEKRGKVEYLQAFLTTTETASEEFTKTQELKEALRKTLPEYMVPRRFTYVQSMPMTPNGKVDRRALLGGIR
jgi:D-alanine--poly(phosphoribitol) ligase subunit 1